MRALLLSLALVSSSAPPASPVDALAKSVEARLLAKDWAGAEAEAAQIVALEPKNGRGWVQLAASRLEQRKWAGAEEAYERALALGTRVPGMLYDLACAAARQGKADKAFALLDKVARNSPFPAAKVEGDEDLASLRGDARWRQLIARMEKAEHPCRTPEHRAFDFWIGEWVVKGTDGNTLGTSRVESILDGCVLEEQWTDLRGSQGRSFNTWDEATKRWKQAWVDQRATHTDFTGRFEDGSLVFLADTVGPGGKPQRTRMTFTPMEVRGERVVRQLLETSDDDGATWQASFDGRYFPRKSGSSAAAGSD